MDGSREHDGIPIHLTALGVPVVVWAAGSEASTLADDIRSAWVWCLSTPGEGDPVELTVVLDTREAEVQAARLQGALAATRADVLLDALSPAVTTAAITRQAGRLLMLHACALADVESGGVVVLVGPSGAGKSTLARTLGRRFAYVTDETVGIREDLTVVPYPKPLSLLDNHPLGLKRQAAPPAQGLLPPPKALQLRRVITLRREAASDSPPRLEEIPTVQALAELAPETSYLKELERPLHRLAAAVTANGGSAHRLHYSEAAELEPVIADLLRTAP